MTTQIDVQALMSRLAQSRTTSEVFKLPMDKNAAGRLLAEAMRLQVEGRGKAFSMEESLRVAIGRVASFLTAPEAKFGLMLMGFCGNGKTTLVRALQSILSNLGIRNPYGDRMELSFFTAKTLARMCVEEDHRAWAAVCRRPLLAIDDLGNEPKQMMAYGNVLTPLVDLLEVRYASRLFTIVTTNSTPEQIRADYGARVADRLKEMMHTIVFTNDSFRQQ